MTSTLERAQELFTEGKIDEAIAVFTMVTNGADYDGDSKADAEFGVGLAYLMGKGELDSAIDHFNKSLEYNVHRADALFNRSVAKTRKGEMEGALQDLNKYLKLNPIDPEAYQNRGFLYIHFNRTAEALEDFNVALRIQPDNYGILNNRANLLLNVLNDPQKALEDLNAAVQLEPKDYIAYKNRGAVNGILGDFQSAMDDFKYCLLLAPPLQEQEEIKEMLEEAEIGLEDSGQKRQRNED